MSVLSVLTSLFHTASADAAKITAGFGTADAFVGEVLGMAKECSTVLAALDPAVGGPILAEVTALEALHATVKAALPAMTGGVNAVAQQVVQLGTQAMDLAVKLGPLFRVVANDAATAAAAVKALSPTAA